MISIDEVGADMIELDCQNVTRVKVTLSNRKELLTILKVQELNDLIRVLGHAKYFGANATIIMDVIDKEDKPCGKSVIFAEDITLVSFSEV
ncbi:hypothetical protein [Weissella viridescens]|uniref:hypothetical protein n=1 Tax=Weissella viridescens TaxID=1629 RepID=UPI004056A47C